MELGRRRLTIVAGHYGSGKTEFSVNLACALGERGLPCTLCDLDVVNPYFRAREQEELLARHGVKLVAPRLQGPEADIPALPAEIFAVLQDPVRRSVLDLGGDGIGARALARFRKEIDPSEAEILFVLNANRPETASVERAVLYMEQIRAVLGLPFTGIVNNTHLCGETGAEDVLRGAALAEETAKETGVPVRCHAVHRALVEQVKQRLTGEILPLQIYMKKPWEVESDDGKSDL